MQTKQKQKTEKYPQSDGNLALADESLVLLQQSQSRDALSFAGLGTGHYGGEDSEAETLGPVTGINYYWNWLVRYAVVSHHSHHVLDSLNSLDSSRFHGHPVPELVATEKM